MIKAGTTLMLENGQWSDTARYGPFIVLKDFSIDDTIEEWCGQRPPVDLIELNWALDENPKHRVHYDNVGTWVTWLIKQGYIIDAPLTRHINLGPHNDTIEANTDVEID